MKIITVKYAMAFHDCWEVSLDGVRELISRTLFDGYEAEVASCIEGTERTVDIPDPSFEAPDAAEACEEWQEKAWEQPEFQATLPWRRE